MYFKRTIAIANILFEESIIVSSKYIKVPKDIFNDILNEVSSLEDVKIITRNPAQGIFECNGLMNDIKRRIKKLQRKYGDLYRIDVHNKSAPQRKRCFVEIKPKLSDMPKEAKAQYKNGIAYFKNGPFKGEEVSWTIRLDSDCIPNEKEVKDDVFLIKPDLYRATFYGWKWKR